jgi:type II secretory pathway pseudopilin PulG
MKAFSSQRGFTLIEMLGVLIITFGAILFSGSVMRDRTLQIDRQASQVASALRLARAKAVSRSSYVGVKFYPAQNNYRVFEDVGPDGLGPADTDYPGPDSGENNRDFDEGEPTQPLVSLGDQTLFGFAVVDATAASPEGLGTTMGTEESMEPVPALNQALVFGPRGRLTTPTDGNPPPYFVYLTNAMGTEARVLRVDPWTGAVQTYRWNWGATGWSYQ